MKIIYLFSTLILMLSCAEKKISEKENNITEIVTNSDLDTLKFSSGITSMLEDNNGNMWLGSLQEGAAFYDGQAYNYFTTNEGLADNQVVSIKEDKNGHIWFETSKGISRLIGSNITTYNKIVDYNTQSEWAKTDSDIWFSAGVNEGIFRYENQKLKYLAFPNPKVVNPNNLYAVTSISEGKNNMLWIGTYAGIFGYNGNNFTIINDETLGLDVEINPLHIRSVLEDSKGRLWIGNNGIGVILKEGNGLINFSKENNLIQSNSTKGDKSPPGTLEHVFAIEEDGEGNIWFGDRDTGIWKYDGETVENYTTNFEQSKDFVHTIYKDKSHEMWFILTNGTVYKLVGNTFVKKF